jgi:Domain of unknown function (DUF4345)
VMLALYLGFNALMYVVLGLWCAIAPRQTSAFVGLQPSGPGGQSEYLAVYGGLEAGLGVFFAWAVAVPEYRRAALLLSILLYLGIVAFRTIAVVRLGFGELGNARYFYVLEILLLLSAVALALWAPGRNR